MNTQEGRVRWGLFRTPIVRHAYGHPVSRLVLPPVRPERPWAPAAPSVGTQPSSQAAPGQTTLIPFLTSPGSLL
jgi:hypothetical protein